MVDIFSKYCVVVPITTKQPDNVLEGIKESIKQHQAKLDSIYSDEEGSFVLIKSSIISGAAKASVIS